MILAGAAALMMVMFASAGEAGAGGELRFAQITIRQQLIIRVPQGAREAAPAGAALIQWEEGRGPRCVDTRNIAGATMLGPSSVDLIMRDNSRVRARLERRCPALDYYYGFFVDATSDGRICADRDFIRSRVGGECRIDQFRSLRPSPAP